MSKILLDKELKARCKKGGITDIPKIGEYRYNGAYWTAEDINKYMKDEIDSYNHSTECPERLATWIDNGRVKTISIPNPLYGKSKI